MSFDPLNDGISKVEYLDHIGSDLTVVNAARVSMNKEHTELTDSDKGLIQFLAQNGHWTPFAHPQIRFRIKQPLFVTREHFRHEVGFARNEMSRRYVKEEPELYLPETKRERPEGVKQGSYSEEQKIEWPEYVEIMNARYRSLKLYNDLLDEGWAPELARMFLPMNTYTEFIETGSLYAYARLCNQRLDFHAQKEIMRYAQAISKTMRDLFPISWIHLLSSKGVD